MVNENKTLCHVDTDELICKSHKLQLFSVPTHKYCYSFNTQINIFITNFLLLLACGHTSPLLERKDKHVRVQP